MVGRNERDIGRLTGCQRGHQYVTAENASMKAFDADVSGDRQSPVPVLFCSV
jgi:hypothetical protein